MTMPALAKGMMTNETDVERCNKNYLSLRPAISDSKTHLWYCRKWDMAAEDFGPSSVKGILYCQVQKISVVLGALKFLGFRQIRHR